MEQRYSQTCLLSLPSELIYAIADEIGSLNSIITFSHTNRHFYHILADYAFKLNMRHEGSSAIRWILRNHDAHRLERMVQFGANPHGPYKHCWNWGLFQAAQAGSLKIVELLIEAGVDAHIEVCGSTPLAEAITRGHEDVVRSLVEKTDVKEVARWKLDKAVFLACWYKRWDMLTVLAEGGFEVTSVAERANLNAKAWLH
ncbi:hypothetical protein EJ04DRAFT_573397 [Polyplosphaeria fusca]|uniref:Ankyrin n=1 Tax=Polyplosphaeria fusca TaxID=682080 RepID=A0A9P4R929_9PLEO|nr:hypothetical protein EJ04DRAFT_573397 [Polyplosphaeria fusca]